MSCLTCSMIIGEDLAHDAKNSFFSSFHSDCGRSVELPGISVRTGDVSYPSRSPQCYHKVSPTDRLR